MLYCTYNHSFLGFLSGYIIPKIAQKVKRNLTKNFVAIHPAACRSRGILATDWIKETSYTDPLDLSLGDYERYKKFGIEDDHLKMMLYMQLFDSSRYNECAAVCGDIIQANKSGTYNVANAYRWIGMCRDMLNEREKAVEAYKKALSFEVVKFAARHDQYGLHITREWIQERLSSPYIRI